MTQRPGRKSRVFRELSAARRLVRVNPLGIKGTGEIGIVGMNSAVANAVYHATGKRVRELPIRLEQLLKQFYYLDRA
jgi:CO/xanthine dehydrogenase Mo-binding subunit